MEEESKVWFWLIVEYSGLIDAGTGIDARINTTHGFTPLTLYNREKTWTKSSKLASFCVTHVVAGSVIVVE